MPGGNHQISITVSQQAGETTTAVLTINASHLKNSPMRVMSNVDSVVFYADQTGYRFAGQPMADGQRLRGQWQQPGFRTVLVLDRMPVTAALAA